jgi:hypothetical protein
MGCAVAPPKPKRRRKGLSAPRPYGELSAAAKARARDCWREKGWTWDECDSEQLTEFFKQELEEEWGIDEAELSWSLGYCQGDGVSFKASLNLEKMAAKNDTVAEIMRQAELLEAAAGWEYSPQWTASISSGSVEVQCYAMDYDDPSRDAQRLLDELASAMEAELEQVYKQACRRLEKLGYAEIEYHDGDEYLDGELTANDHYLFTEEGEFDS